MKVKEEPKSKSHIEEEEKFSAREEFSNKTWLLGCPVDLCR
jgi:hypothetical protein